MSAANEGLVWDGLSSISGLVEARLNGFHYVVYIGKPSSAYIYTPIDGSGRNHTFATTSSSNTEMSKSVCQAHADAVAAAISKHRLDAERLANCLELMNQTRPENITGMVKVWQIANEALAAHREAIK